MRPQRVLLTGATGFVGQSLGLALARQGYTLAVLTRDPASAKNKLPFPAQIFSWDELPQALQNSDAIIHLAGESVGDGRWTQKKKQEILESRTQTVQKIITAIQTNRPSRLKTLIGASAIGFYGNDRGDEELDETSSQGSDFLAKVCQAQETELFALSQELRTVSIRVGIVLGNNGGALKRILPFFRSGVGGPIGMGRQWMSWIHIDDLVRIFTLALETPSMRGTYNGVSPQPVRNREWTQALAQTLQKPALLPVPPIALRILFGEFSNTLSGSLRVSSEKVQNLGFLFQYADIRSTLRALIPSPEEQIFETYQWVPQPVSQVFPFFSHPENLEKLTPDFLDFSILSKTSDSIQQDSRINYKIKIHGVPVRWKTRIAHWDPPRSFVDIQEKGPYRFWHHTHQFESIGEGTLLYDQVRYRLYLGTTGALLAGHWVQQDIKKIFAYRHQVIGQIFGQK